MGICARWFIFGCLSPLLFFCLLLFLCMAFCNMSSQPSCSFVGLITPNDWTWVNLCIHFLFSTSLIVLSAVIFHCLYIVKSSVASLIFTDHTSFSPFYVQIGYVFYFEQRFTRQVGDPFFNLGTQNFQTVRLYFSEPTFGGGTFHVLPSLDVIL